MLLAFISFSILSILHPQLGSAATQDVSTDDCQTIRLDRPGGSMFGAPTRDQGDVGICYAVVASELFDAWRRKHPSPLDASIGKESSALYASLLYALDESNGNLRCPSPEGKGETKLRLLMEGGQECDTFDAMFEKGACSSTAVNGYFSSAYADRLSRAGDDMQSTRAALDRKQRAYRKHPSKKLLAEIEELRRENTAATLDYRHVRDSSPEADLQILRTVYNDHSLEEACHKYRRFTKPSCGGDLMMELSPEAFGFSDLEKEVKHLAASAVTELKTTLEKASCKEPGTGPGVPVPEPECVPECTDPDPKGLSSDNPAKSRRLIQEALSKPDALPVGVGMCSAVFYSEQQFEIWHDAENIKIPSNRNWRKSPKCGNHAVIIIGQERNPATGKCQLILRNSWGPNCRKLCDDAHCSCDPATGDIHIDRDITIQNSSNLAIISDPKECSE